MRNGRTLKAARVLAGLTQRQLAAAARLHPNAVKYWERRPDRIAGQAVSRMIEALERYGVHCGEEYGNSGSGAVLRCQFLEGLNRSQLFPTDSLSQGLPAHEYK